MLNEGYQVQNSADKCKLIYRDKNHAVADSKCGGRSILSKHLRNSMFQRLGVEYVLDLYHYGNCRDLYITL